MFLLLLKMSTDNSINFIEECISKLTTLVKPQGMLMI